MSNIKDVQQIQALIAEGKKKGFLTFDELNKALPSEVNTPEQIDEIIVIFDQLDIDIVDEKLSRGIEIAEDDGEEPKEEEKLELDEDEDGGGEQYIRGLTRDGRIFDFAKRGERSLAIGKRRLVAPCGCCIRRACRPTKPPTRSGSPTGSTRKPMLPC